MAQRTDESLDALYSATSIPLDVVQDYLFPPLGHVFKSQAERTDYLNVIQYIRDNDLQIKKDRPKNSKALRKHEILCRNCSGVLTTTQVAKGCKAWKVTQVLQCQCKKKSCPLDGEIRGETCENVFSMAIARLRQLNVGPFVGEQKSSPAEWAGSQHPKRTGGGNYYLYLRNVNGLWCELKVRKQDSDGSAACVLITKLSEIKFFGCRGSTWANVPTRKRARLVKGQVIQDDNQEDNGALKMNDRATFFVECQVCCEKRTVSEMFDSNCFCKDMAYCLHCLLHIEKTRPATTENFPFDIEFPSKGEGIRCLHCRKNIVKYKTRGSTCGWSIIAQGGWLCNMFYPNSSLYEENRKKFSEVYDPYVSHAKYLRDMRAAYRSERKQMLLLQAQVSPQRAQEYKNMIEWIDRYLPIVEDELQTCIYAARNLETIKFLQTKHKHDSPWELPLPQNVKDELEKTHTGLPDNYTLRPLLYVHEYDKTNFPNGRTIIEKWYPRMYFTLDLTHPNMLEPMHMHMHTDTHATNT